MQLAIEYLARQGMLRQLFEVPCSLFVVGMGMPNKISITISEEFKPSNFYCVKHWRVHECDKKQALPSFAECRVPKSEIFDHEAIIMPDYRSMIYHASPIPFSHNQYNRPMKDETYNYYYDNYLNSYRHREEKINWLWDCFLSTYLPHLCGKSHYISQFKSDSEIASDQRSMVAASHTEVWQCWSKWCKYMLYLDGIPGELVFMDEYRKSQGGSWTRGSSQASPSLLLS